MAAYRQVIAELSDDFKAREIARLVYFHCDHFEPWVPFGGRDTLDERNAEHLRFFADDLRQIDYARKLTLFYKPNINFAYDRSRELIRAADDDLVGFVPRSEREVAAARANMKYLSETSTHEFQLHIHHEGYTYNTSHTDPAIVAFYASERARALDGQRLALAIRLAKQAILLETDVALDHWYFVHGHWALNAADDDSCTITDELALLMGEGCRGDFTFPARRSQVNPRTEGPYFCKPIRAVRAYDQPEAEPEFAYGNKAAAAEKFFVWASKMKHNRASLDYYAPWVRQSLEQPEEWARDIISQSFVADRTLFFKTHAHSMFPYYRQDKRRPVYPHAHPGIQTVFSLVFDAAAAAGVELEFATVSEVFARFVAADYAPPDGYRIDIAAPPADRECRDLEHAPTELAVDPELVDGEAATIPLGPEPKSSDHSGGAAVAPPPPPSDAPPGRPDPARLAIEQAATLINSVVPKAATARDVILAQFVRQLPP